MESERHRCRLEAEASGAGGFDCAAELDESEQRATGSDGAVARCRIEVEGAARGGAALVSRRTRRSGPRRSNSSAWKEQSGRPNADVIRWKPVSWRRLLRRFG